MAKKCIGVREDSGEPCPRPASGDSDFCWVHKQQERDMKILYLQDDVYHCPDDGQKLLYVPRWKEHKCDMCKGFLLNAKEIDPMLLESILTLPEVTEEGLAVECPTCSTDSDLSDGETPLSNFAAEWHLVSKGKIGFVPIETSYYGVSKIGHCKVCGSTWFPSPGERDALGKKVGWKALSLWRNAMRSTDLFGKQQQSSLREGRKRAEAKKCQHVDSNGKRCTDLKVHKYGDFCFRHRQKR